MREELYYIDKKIALVLIYIYNIYMLDVAGQTAGPNFLFKISFLIPRATADTL